MDINKKVIGITISIAAVSGIVTGVLLSPDKPLTLDEYQAYIEIVDYEAKQMGGIKLENVNSSNIIEKINEKIIKRPVVEDNIKIKNNILNKDEYTNVRQELINKVNKL